MTLNHPIVYLRGLSGGGTDRLNLGPLPLPVHMTKPWCDFLRSQGAKVFAVEGMGRGLLSEQITRAEAYLEKNAAEFEGGFHLVGHSAGGLIAWGLASRPRWKGKILSLTTMATPHAGARLAESFLARYQSSRRLKMFDKIGYETDIRARMFTDLTREGIKAFKELHPVDPNLPVASYSFSILPEHMTWPIRLAYLMGLQIPGHENDGFVELESQKVGKSLGHYQLDHLAQIGYHFHINPRKRAANIKLFQEVGLGLLKHLEQIEQVR